MPADIKRPLPMPMLRSALDRSLYAPAPPPRTCPSGVRRPAGHVPQHHRAKRPCSTRCAEMLGLIVDRPRHRIPAIGLVSSRRHVEIAVVVQRMINAEVAGVMFTADPVSGDRKTILVDASSGLGEAVVSGLVLLITMCWTTRATSGIFSRDAARSSSRAAAAGGVVREAGGTDDAQRLPDSVACRAGTAGHDESPRHFGRPQDIEWAYADRTRSGCCRRGP